MATRTIVRAPRRRRFWVRTDTAIPFSVTTAFFDLFSQWRTTQGVTGNPIGTIAGVRLSFLHNVSSPSVVNGIHIGLTVAPSIGGVADPFTQPNADWMMNTHYFKVFDASGGTSPSISREVVIKAQRKLTDSQNTLFLAIANDSSPGTLNVHASALFLV